jgi:thioredoxin-like negative regulator of GroEL
MRKKLFILISILLAGNVIAQTGKLQTAEQFLRNKDYTNAIAAIDEAAANSDTKNNARVWYIRGMAYLQKALVNNTFDAADIARASFERAIALQPDYNEAEINDPLYNTAVLTFNAAVVDYGNKAYSQAYNKFMKVQAIYKINGGRRFSGNTAFTGINIAAKTNAGYSASANMQYAVAANLFEEVLAENPGKDSSIYQSLVEIYLKGINQADKEKLVKVLTAARTYFPESRYFRDRQINYYISNGKQKELFAALEEAIAKDPNNPELLFNLANAYEQLGYPTDAAGALLQQQEGTAGYVAKAENFYKRALAIVPGNADYNFNLAILYYNAASLITKKLAEIKGTTPEENTRYEALLVDRKRQFDLALPYFENAYNLLDKRSTSLNESEKVTYRNAMIGLREIYSRGNDKEKLAEINNKLSMLK